MLFWVIAKSPERRPAVAVLLAPSLYAGAAGATAGLCVAQEENIHGVIRSAVRERSFE